MGIIFRQIEPIVVIVLRLISNNLHVYIVGSVASGGRVLQPALAIIFCLVVKNRDVFITGAHTILL